MFTSTSMRPRSPTVRSTTERQASGSAHVERLEAGALAERVGHGATLVLANVGQDDPGSFLGEAPRDHLAGALGRARHDRDLVLEPSHPGSSFPVTPGSHQPSIPLGRDSSVGCPAARWILSLHGRGCRADDNRR